jgi:ABC-2 type transport system permease protein
LLRGAIGAAWLKKTAEYRAYLFDFAVGLAIKFVFFMAALYVAPLVEPAAAMVRVYGFVIWYLSAHLLAKTANVLIEEAYLGTLGQVLVARIPFSLFALSVGLVELLFSSLWVMGFLAIAGAVAPILPALRTLWGDGAKAAVFAAVNFAGMGGLGLLLLSMSIRFKRVGAIAEILTFYLLFFSGFFFPISQLPTVVRHVDVLSPLYWAILGITKGWRALPYALASSLFWLFLGMILFRYYWDWARRAGTLTAYA